MSINLNLPILPELRQVAVDYCDFQSLQNLRNFQDFEDAVDQSLDARIETYIQRWKVESLKGSVSRLEAMRAFLFHEKFDISNFPVEKQDKLLAEIELTQAEASLLFHEMFPGIINTLYARIYAIPDLQKAPQLEFLRVLIWKSHFGHRKRICINCDYLNPSYEDKTFSMSQVFMKSLARAANIAKITFIQIENWVYDPHAIKKTMESNKSIEFKFCDSAPEKFTKKDIYVFAIILTIGLTSIIFGLTRLIDKEPFNLSSDYLLRKIGASLILASISSIFLTALGLFTYYLIEFSRNKLNAIPPEEKREMQIF